MLSGSHEQALSRITSTGAMTFCFIQAIERGHGQTYGSILGSMRNTIRNTGSGGDIGGGQVTSLITMLLTGGSVGGLGGGLRQVFTVTEKSSIATGTGTQLKPFMHPCLLLCINLWMGMNMPVHVIATMRLRF